MAGVAGALYVPQVGIINPSEFAPGQFDRGGDLGRGRRPRHADRRGARRGPRQLRQDLLHLRRRSRPTGCSCSAALFVAVTLFLPRGIVGTVAALDWRERRESRGAADDGAPSRDAGAASRRSERMDSASPPRCSISTASPSRSTASGRSTICRSSIEPGEMRAIIGPNGAGKTTMMDVVTGKTRPDEGDVLVRRRARSHQARRGRDRRARHRPQIPEADRVRDAHGRGQSAAGAEGRPARARDACCWRDSRRRARRASTSCSTPSA